ncbi:VOC family protein [Actinomadura algeriensis]|uniref:Enzyme related to lactoylglutathione lyase n=1 Tax=Actinomadura algeriensis TaxID=1679523 RepID=A0ABR9JK05_9ACTN|nr:VOC family protein [Actinomadura algeriensis]MBE1530867.1 putative enzyme related to lactoylglutathione lyase [Actinomadura algeriensis]
MPKVTEYQPGMACWLDLASPDIEASKRFYRELFGWSSYTITQDAFADYEVFTLGGADGPTTSGLHMLADETQPPSWTVYFRVVDVEETGRAVTAAGGRELVMPMLGMHLGRVAMYSDLEGADFAVWQPFGDEGMEIPREPTSMCWVELASRDIHGARRFYGDVFGWRTVDREYYSAAPYTEWRIDGEQVGGGMAFMDERWPPHWNAHWTPYFWVTDCDATVWKAAELGARVVIPPTDIRPGRFATIIDPIGARLAMITPDPSAEI